MPATTGPAWDMPRDGQHRRVSAAGNVRHRSIERVASAVGEGSIAIQLIHEYLGEQWRLVTADQARR